MGNLKITHFFLYNEILPAEKIKYYIYFLTGLALVVFFVAIFQKLFYSPDDTFIYMQYAKNIAAGSGFSFNPGEQSYGITGPVWVIMITAAYTAGTDGFWFSKILDLICVLVSILIFFRLTGIFFKQKSLLRYTAVFIFTVNIWLIRWAFTGMETSLAVLLTVTVFYLFYLKKYNLMFFLLGVFYLVRPESLVLSVLLFSLILLNSVKEKSFSLTEYLWFLLSFAAVVVPFMIYAQINFGTILPNTALGKSTLTLNAGVIFLQLKEIFKTLAASSFPEMILTILFLVNAIRTKNLQGTLPLLLWPAALISLYVVTDADIISRYLLVITPMFILTGLKFIEGLNSYKTYYPVVLLVICLLYSQIMFYKFVKPSTDNFTQGVNECFIPIGEWLNKNTPEGSKILVNDVGAIGYYSNRYIIDAAALVNRDLELNRKIMSTPVIERLSTHTLLNIVQADYVIDRDPSELVNIEEFNGKKLELMVTKKFPGLGIRDTSPRYYKVYKVIK